MAIIKTTMSIFTNIGKFNPGWKFIIFISIILPILLSLSFWQYQRGLEKSKLESFINNQQTKPPTEFISLEYASPSQWYRPFFMQGKFSKKTVLVDNAIYEGVRGFSVYQEFLSNNGLSLLVSKGWSNSFDSSKKTLDQNYLLQGVFRPIEKAFTIDNSIYEREESDLEMQSFDIDSINLKWNTNFPAVVFELDEFSLDGFSRIWQPVYLSANRHFGYAIQWLGLSLVALAGFIFAGFRKND